MYIIKYSGASGIDVAIQAIREVDFDYMLEHKIKSAISIDVCNPNRKYERKSFLGGATFMGDRLMISAEPWVIDGFKQEVYGFAKEVISNGPARLTFGFKSAESEYRAYVAACTQLLPLLRDRGYTEGNGKDNIIMKLYATTRNEPEFTDYLHTVDQAHPIVLALPSFAVLSRDSDDKVFFNLFKRMHANKRHARRSRQ